ncbi:MAG TPA: alpha/beta fold hydrolase, partial [Anaerolineae bacterium]
TQREGLANNFVTSIAFAANKVAWIGTLNGVTRIEGRSWTTYTRGHGLGDSWVNAIAVAPDRRVWFATASGGLSVFDGQAFTTFNLDNSAIPSNFLTALAIDSKGTVWVGTLSDGVARFEPNVKRWTRYALANPFITRLVLDANGLPHAQTDGEAFRFDGQAWKSEQPAGTPDNSQLAAQIGVTANNIRVSKMDDEGRYWIGTTRGLFVPNAVADSIRFTPPLPVVLVHGWTGPASDKIGDSEFRYLQKYASQDGLSVYFAEGVNPENTLYQNAVHLRDDIAQVKQQTGADKVNVIAFSMGGLNTRAYLESSLYADDINRVIIIGTPHQGEEVWYPILTQLILRNADQPSGLELIPEGTQVFNTTHGPRASVPYDLLAGDASRQTNLDFFSDLPASDALVSAYSALGLDAPNVRRALNADLHAFEPTAIPYKLTSFLYPQDTYERYLRNALRDSANTPLGLLGPEASVTRTITFTRPAPRNHTPLVSGKINAGETVTRSVTLDANKSARFIAYYPGGEFQFTLTAPDGAKYTDDNSPASANQNAVKLKADIASFTGYAFKNAPAGKWSLTLTRTDKGTGAVDVLTYVDLEASTGIALGSAVRGGAAGNILRVGETAAVRVTVTNPVANLAVRARVIDPDRVEQTLTLFDDGTHGDEKANDGIYANAVTAAKSGHYVVVVSVTGDRFERGAEMTFPVASDAARLNGVGDVKTTAGLGVQVRVNVKSAGHYAVGAALRTPRGDVVARLTTDSLSLAPGEQTVPLLFPARDLAARGLNGPYILDLTLLDTQWAALVLDEQLGAFMTPAYNVNDFR